MPKTAANDAITKALLDRFDNQYPLWNKLGDGGRYINANKNGIGIAAAAFNATLASLSAYTAVNANTVADAGQFIHNNNDFGGTAGAMTPAMVLLQNAIAALATPTNFTGKSKRYGPEFRAARYTAAGPGILSASGHVGGGIDGKMTFGGWFLVEGAGTISFTGCEALWINGVSVAVGTTISSADGWKHVAWRMTNTGAGYNNPALWNASGAGVAVLVAMPAYLIGDFGGYVWGHPIDNPAGSL
jgi:hypothetical protein